MDKTHSKSELGLMLSASLIALMILGVSATIPFGNAAFTTLEQYGPNVDQLLCLLYANKVVEFEDLDLGRIDLVDAPLIKYYIDLWNGDPDIVMQDYGGDIGMREFDINLNETRGICTAAGTDETTMQKNIGTVFAFRHAVAHLTDRAYYVSTILQGFATPQYTFVPAALGGWVNTGAEKHIYSPTEAASILAAGDIHDTDGDGYFDWPGTADGSSDKIIVDFCLRIDDTPGRYEAGLALIAELQAQHFFVPVWSATDSVGARKWWDAGKGAVIYTGGRSLSRDPDFLYDLFHSSMYWHPGRPPNVAHINDPELDAYLEGIKFAENAAAAMPNCQEAQRVMADKALVIPAWSASAPLAVRAQYTGGTDEVPVSPDDGENQYRGKDWQGMTNEAGNGLNSWWSTLGAHVNDGSGWPISGGVLRYGLSTSALGSLNPVYANSQWDWEVLERVYESLLRVNPYDLSEDLEWVAKRWDVGIWTVDSGDYAGQQATKLVFEMRDDVYWHDGQQLDADDVIFTMQDLVSILSTRGLPPPWYYGSIMGVHDVVKVSQFKVEVRMNLKSYFALHWIGGNIILPEHVWRPIVTSGDPESFSPDPQLIGNGPFKVYPHSIAQGDNDYYVPNQYVKMDAFKPTSPGYFNNGPIRMSIAAHGSYIDAYLQNYYNTPITATVSATASGTPLTGGGSVAVPARPGNGNMPGVSIARFNAPAATGTYDIVATATYSFGARTISKTLTKRLLTPSVDGDCNNNQNVEIWDAIHLSHHFSQKAYVWPEDDLNADNKIDIMDAMILTSNWGEGSDMVPSPPGPATIYISPIMSTGVVGATFSVDVMISDAIDLYGYEFKMFFDPNIIAATSVSAGDFFPTPPGYRTWRNEIGYNYAWVGFTRPFGGINGISGSGRLATIYFTVIGNGGCYLNLDNIFLGDTFCEPIGCTKLGAYFSNLPQTTMLADLVKRKSNNRPGERIFRISVHGTTQTLYGEVENLGTVPILTRVRFEIYDITGLPPPGGIMYSAIALLAPGQSAVLTAGMPINLSMLGKWYVTNYCEYDSNGDGTLDAQGSRTMSYDFKVQR